uniref:Uncharacterized protein n=1 Tax=Rangifer tarandus platyrhynchus TaxID=3082113 RepID=A0ACB0EUQ1_RANTA|nr:unnamed protein product [Rangifer tarandus platyrhynchus]
MRPWSLSAWSPSAASGGKPVHRMNEAAIHGDGPGPQPSPDAAEVLKIVKIGKTVPKGNKTKQTSCW